MAQQWSDCVLHSNECGISGFVKDTELYQFSELRRNIKTHCNKLKINVPNFTEASLVMNRIGSVFEDEKKICPYHRYKNGIYWRPPTTCKHPNHGKQMKKIAVRSTNYVMSKKISDRYQIKFPIGLTLCTQCRNKEEKIIIEQNDDAEDSNDNFPDPIEPNVSLKEEFNTAVKQMPIMQKHFSPIKYQVTTPISLLSENTKRSLKRKYEKGINAFSIAFANTVCPGQGEEFLSMLSQSTDNSDDLKMEEYADLVAAVKTVPNVSTKIILMSTIASKFSVCKWKDRFIYSQRLVEHAKEFSFREDAEILQKILHPDPKIRQRLDMNKVEHFINFIFNAGFIQDVAFGTTKIALSNGKKFEIPHAVRTIQRSHIILAYVNYCKTNDIVPLSTSSLWRVIDACKASQRQGTQCLDTFIADGLNGFESLKNMMQLCNFDPAQQTQIQINLEKCKHYLKAVYPTHVMNKESKVASHCRIWALSDTTDKDLQEICQHDHTQICEDCDRLQSTLEDVQNIVEENQQSNKEELQHEVQNAAFSILEWQKHILRGNQQEYGKNKLKEMINETTIYWLRDWGMKILPQRFRETMQEWFGKRGISNHIDCIFFMSKNGKQEKVTYVTLADNCTQDMYAILCIFKHVLFQVKKDFPGVTKIVDRSDNAGCYSTVNVIAGKAAIALEMGFEIIQSEFNEPQRGKDQCDRDSAIIKKHIRSYLHSGHDITSAQDIFTALLSLGGVRNVKPSVIEILYDEGSIDKITMKGISMYHSANLQNPQGIRFWKHHNIGIGKQTTIQCQNVNHKLKFNIINSFPRDFPSGKPPQNKKTQTQMPTLFCPEMECTSSFKTVEEFDNHVFDGQHSIAEDTSLTGDRVKIMYVKKMKTGVKNSFLPSTSLQGDSTLFTSFTKDRLYDSMGWALKKRKSNPKLSLKQKKFIYEAFISGEQSGRKISPETLVNKMKNLTNEYGKKFYSVNEYLSKYQVMSQFTILASHKKKQTLHSYLNTKRNKTDVKVHVDESDEEDEEDVGLESEVDEYHYKETCQAIAEIEYNLMKMEQIPTSCKPKIEQFKYYGVYYTKNCYLGKIMCSKDTVTKTHEVKFLHKTGVNQYDWPRRPDIENISESVIFFGPVEISGMPPFCLSNTEEKELQDSYQKFKKEVMEKQNNENF